MKGPKGTPHDQLADRIGECVAAVELLCASDPAPILAGAASDLRRALSAVRDRAAAVKVHAELHPRSRKETPSDVLREIHARRTRFGRPRRPGLAALLGGRG